MMLYDFLIFSGTFQLIWNFPKDNGKFSVVEMKREVNDDVMNIKYLESRVWTMGLLRKGKRILHKFW